jgi:hypothetical protein
MEKHRCKAVIRTSELIKPRLHIKYPRAEGVIGPNMNFALQAVNMHILSKVYELIREQGYVQDPSKEMSGDYEMKLNDQCLLSLLLTNFTYAQGAAHGLTLAKGLTVDLVTGHAYKLNELFRAGSGYRMRISDWIKREIKAKDVPLIAEFKSIEPDHQDFYMTAKELVIFFQLYEYTPYAYGIPYFHIPYSELEDLLSEKSPIGRFL